ncbi:GNAT family N-acetyltransferase [Chlorobium ferrooxidans]|uniref:GNAT family N-acetyltransferase n=1 Tax=Chlorobium ferrooxidans TaxID=84205 RepID=UPI00058E24BE|nr:GNAT family N-acetyltransferase [Chlorobium ferrooxidans]
MTQVEFKIETYNNYNILESDLNICAEIFSNDFGYWINNRKLKLSSLKLKKFFISSDSFISIAKIDNEPIGYLIALNDTQGNNKPFYWISQIVVKEKYRRKGVASRLISSIDNFEKASIGILTRNIILEILLSRLNKQIIYDTWPIKSFKLENKFCYLLDLYLVDNVHFSNTGCLTESTLKFETKEKTFTYNNLKLGMEKLIFAL